MTEFRTCMVEAGVDLIVDDDTAADTGAERDHNGVCVALCCTCDCFALCSSVCVVFDEDAFDTDILLEQISDREIEEL